MLTFRRYMSSTPSANKCLGSLASYSLFSYLIQPTRVTSNSKSIIDNIFCNITSTNLMPDSIMARISYHLPHFLVAPEISRNFTSNKFNYFERDQNNFNQENFILGYFSVDWKNIINLQKNDVNHSLQRFFDLVND